MIAALMALLACQVAGELVARLLGLPIPGPVIGTVLLFVLLLIRGRVPDAMRDVARGLLTNLSLLFVPAGVGIIQHLDRIRGEWVGILAALVGSTVLTMLVAVFVFRLVSRLSGADRGGMIPIPHVIEDVWVYLSATPLLWLTATLAAYLTGQWLFERAGRRPLVNPVAIAVVLLIVLLKATGTTYQTYFDGAQFVHFLLGPATVALAVPLHQNFSAVRRAALPMLAALLAGSVTAVVSAVAIAMAFGVSSETMRSLAPKSVTTPIAMGIAEKIGGIPSLTAVMVIITGIVGAMTVTPLMNLLRVSDWRARGFAAGVASHGIGTARAFQVNEVAGTFAGIAMALNGIATAIMAPLLISLLG